MPIKPYTTAGIEPLKTSIRIWWRTDGIMHRETLKLKPDADGLHQAKQLTELIKLENDMGVFNLERHFPDSRSLSSSYFDAYLIRYLSVMERKLAPTSFKSYKQRIETHIMPHWGHKLPSQISADAVEHWVDTVLTPKLHTKTVREIVALFNAVWRRVSQKTKLPTPAGNIKLLTADKDDVDPFTRREIDALLSAEANPMWRDIWTILLWSGLSFHEWHTLSLTDIDLEQGLITVQRSSVRGQYRVTKTRRRKRTVQMLAPVKEAITRQMQREHIINQPLQIIEVLGRDNQTTKPYQVKWLWLNPDTGTHYTYAYLYKYFKRAQQNAEVRQRGPNNGRHTFASQLISTGLVPLAWIADQLGHESTKMLHEHYGRWIKEDGPDLIKQLNEHFTQSL